MKVLVAGATGGCGRLVVRRLTELGLDARAFTRDRARARSLGIPDVIEGNALLPDDCLRAIEGCQAVICTLGERWVPRDHRIVDGDGDINLARAAETLGARRFVLISGSMTRAPFLVRGFFRLLRVVPVIEEKIRSESFIRSSGLEWTVLWPGFLTYFRMGEEPVVLPTTARAPGLPVGRRQPMSPSGVCFLITRSDRCSFRWTA